ncbi:MAG: hypothetical protein LBB36_03465, partial [Fibromonadaceae bacterium]|nr:hypothetical protein [Fibromonadaceae bacterium]
MTENKQKCGTKKTRHTLRAQLIVPLLAFLFFACDDGGKVAETQFNPEEQLAEIQGRIDSLEYFISNHPVLKAATVEPNFGLFQTLQSVGLDLKQSLKIINTLADTVELGTLKAGQVFWVGFDQKDTSKVVLFRYAENLATLHFLIDDGSGEWVCKMVEKPVNVLYAMYEGILQEGG